MEVGPGTSVPRTWRGLTPREEEEGRQNVGEPLADWLSGGAMFLGWRPDLITSLG